MRLGRVGAALAGVCGLCVAGPLALGAGAALAPAPAVVLGSPVTFSAYQSAEAVFAALKAAVGTPGARSVAAEELKALGAFAPPAKLAGAKGALESFARALMTPDTSPAALSATEAAAQAELAAALSAAGPVPNPPGDAQQMDALGAAESQIGAPYVWGGETPGVAFDCSGLVQWAFAQAQISLPRVAQTQFDAGPKVPSGQPLVAGDLVFFHVPSDGPGIGHVGIYVGDGWMIDAPHTGATVRFDQFSTGPPVAGQEVKGNWGTFVGATDPGGVPSP